MYDVARGGGGGGLPTHAIDTNTSAKIMCF